MCALNGSGDTDAGVGIDGAGVTDDIGIVVGPFFEFAGESKADFGDSLSMGGIFGVRYRFNDTLTAGLGIMARSEIEDDAYVQPWVNLDWGATEDVKVSISGGSSRGGQLRAGYTFLEQNKAKEGVETTSSGLQYKVLEEGGGRSPGPEDTVTVHYRGTLISGQVFDSTRTPVAEMSRTKPRSHLIQYGWSRRSRDG